MPIYVIKSWYSSNQPDTDGNYILIEGRQEGLISWLLSVFRIEPTVTIRVTENKVEQWLDQCHPVQAVGHRKQKIDEQHAAYVCDLTQHLIEAKFRSLRTP